MTRYPLSNITDGRKEGRTEGRNSGQAKSNIAPTFSKRGYNYQRLRLDSQQ